jgi:deoxyhypusine synthase
MFLHQVDCLVTTAGGIEEDFIKCLAPTYIGDFYLKGNFLRATWQSNLSAIKQVFVCHMISNPLI